MLIVPDALEDQQAARAEAHAAQTAYRRRVRSSSVAIVFGLAAVLALTAILPTTHAADRAGLIATAGLIVIAGALWFAFVPQSAFPRGRIFVAAAIAQGVMVLMLGITSGSASVYFPYYLLPVLIMILSGSWRQSAVVGALAAAGMIGLALGGPLSDFERDVTVTRLLEIATITFFSAATALATGETRRTLAARTETLATERDDAFQMAVTDELTGLYNRHYMRDELRRMSAHATRRDRPFAIISLDVDGLKAVNDSRGHQAGDELLRGVAASLRSVLRSEDIAVRTGGDEFVVLLPDADRGEAVKVAYRIRQRIAALGDHGARGLSSGIAVWRRGTDPDEILREADEELYRAKATRARNEAG
ncbi:MAG TPA: GGDEF domain-containing protein [Candidatus Saccharimonadales bacterium]|nr:GGDEF domain-containing protein [Candidatus Saccharimonadales bacterium]